MSATSIIPKVKEIVKRYDRDARIILFGSQALGDAGEESDWDFLILSTLPEGTNIQQQFRLDVLNEIEWKSFEVINIIWHNNKVWEEDYKVTNIYQALLRRE